MNAERKERKRFTFRPEKCVIRIKCQTDDVSKSGVVLIAYTEFVSRQCKSKLAMRNCTLFSCNQRRMANTFDCEPYLRALEEQADSIGGAANGILQAMGSYRENAELVLRSVENLKKMVQMTRRAMVLAMVIE